MSISVQKLQRRGFIKLTAGAAGGLMLGFALPEGLEAQFGPPGGAAITPNAFIRIAADDIVTLIIDKPENGQGIETALAMLLAEELDCEWSKVRTQFAPIDAALYGGALQGTFGSLAVRTTYEPMRRTGAAARDLLLQAAAVRWGSTRRSAGPRTASSSTAPPPLGSPMAAWRRRRRSCPCRPR